MHAEVALAAEDRCMHLMAAEDRCMHLMAAEDRCMHLMAAEDRCMHLMAAEVAGGEADSQSARRPASIGWPRSPLTLRRWLMPLSQLTPRRCRLP